MTGISTGFKKLDEMTSGLQPGDLIIIAGRPSMGKTTLAVNIAENAALGSQQIGGDLQHGNVGGIADAAHDLVAGTDQSGGASLGAAAGAGLAAHRLGNDAVGQCENSRR